jgi:Tol biopolymer transport system component
VVFLAEEGEGDKRTRDVYYMNLDGTGRTKVGENGRQPFWSPDGKRIAYLRGTAINYNEGGSTNKELRFYNIETREYSEHPKKDIAGLLNPCWSPNGKWIVASAMGGLGFDSSIVAIEANGTKVVEIARSHSEAKNVYQCRPDVSPDSRHVAWGKEDVDNRLGAGPCTTWVEVADVDFDSAEPKITQRRYVVTGKYPLETYHVDWSPDGQYIAYARGSKGGKMDRARYVVGVQAPGWDIWVVKPSEPEVTVQVTHDGLSSKEPDWIPVDRDRK